MTEPFKILGAPGPKTILIVGDHASNFVPADIDLGIPADLLDDHIAVDIGTAQVTQIMCERPGYMGILGGVSRLVTDLNRYPSESSVIPTESDGIAIPGNIISDEQRQTRLDQYFHPYHNRVAKLISALAPVFVLFIHSFTPRLRSQPSLERPWDIGVLYNDQASASHLALQYLNQEDLFIGDQEPYSGKLLNASMVRQAEAIGQAYTEIEIRQDLISDETGQRRIAEILLRICDKMRTGLA